MKEKLRSWWKSKVFIAVVLSVLLLGGVVAYAGVISNLWTSPNVTVTTGGGGGNPPPANLPLVISSPDFTTDRAIYTGGTVTANITLTNPSPSGAPGYTGVLIALTINKTGILLSEVTLAYNDGTTWLPLPLTQQTNMLTAMFGPLVTGFPVGYGYSESTPLRATFNAAGVYYATAQVTN